MRRLWIFGALALAVAGCGSSEGRSIDFGEGVTPDSRRPRDRPYPCPNLEPIPGSRCTTNELSCGYGDRTCSCAADRVEGFGTLRWTCDSAPTEGCPELEPQPGAACTTLFGAPECEFDRNNCHCATESQRWACWDPDACARRAPEEASECSIVGMTCAYSDTSCECFSDGWRCE